MSYQDGTATILPKKGEAKNFLRVSDEAAAATNAPSQRAAVARNIEASATSTVVDDSGVDCCLVTSEPLNASFQNIEPLLCIPV